MNGIMYQGFEWYLPADASLWNKLKVEAKNLKESGITAIWLPPAYKGANGREDVGYAVYDLYDLGEFDQKGSIPTKYGTIAEYLEAVKALKEQGIYVMADIVLNQRIGADEVEEVLVIPENENNRVQDIGGEKKIKAWTKFTFPGRKGKYSDYIWSCKDFDGADWDASCNQKGIFRFAGTGWEADVDSQYGNYDYLMGDDVDTDVPGVIQELNKWGKWYVETTGIDGFRLDAVKHISANFYKNWLNAMRSVTKQELFSVGEYWSHDIHVLQNYLAAVGHGMSLFDVPLHFKFYEASNGNGYFDMRTILDNTLVKADPVHAVTFVDNHDTQPGQALSSWVNDWFKPLAYAITLLRYDGYPCVFTGDYQGIPHDNKPEVRGLKTLMNIRNKYAYGIQHDYFDDPNIIGWTREGDPNYEHSGIAVIMTDSVGGKKYMYVGPQFAGKTFVDALGNINNTVYINADGCGEFYVNGGSVSVYMEKLL